jgi:hypothetical protein
MSALRRPADPVVPEPTRLTRGWQPLPDDILEWMGANPYPRAAEQLEESA